MNGVSRVKTQGRVEGPVYYRRSRWNLGLRWGSAFRPTLNPRMRGVVNGDR